MKEAQNKIVVFQEKQIRRVWHNEEWWFSVVDIVEVLSESHTPRRYWSDLKIKLKKEGYVEVYEKIVQLKMKAPDEKMRETDAANTETMFRIIQSIPAGQALHAFEGETGKKVVTDKNFKQQIAERKKRKNQNSLEDPDDMSSSI